MRFYNYTSPEGFKFRHRDTWGDFLFIESAKLPEALEYIKAHGPIQLDLNSGWGFKQKNLRFLRDVQHLITGLAIVADDLNLQGIEKLAGLRNLTFGNEQGYPLPFERFPNLSYLATQWNKFCSQAVFPPSLEDLNLWAYNPRFGFNEASLHNLVNVTKIQLVQAMIADLSLIDYCGALTQVNIAYSSKTLTDISALTRHAGSLTRLDLDKCKKIADFSPLASLSHLEWLNIVDCKSIPNLAFLQHLPKLKHFVFRGTVVEDGDLSYLRGIDYVWFDNKPHYSAKNTDFERD